MSDIALASLSGLLAATLGGLLSYAVWRWGAHPATTTKFAGSVSSAFLRGLQFSLWSVVLSVWTLGGPLARAILGIPSGSTGSFDHRLFQVFSFWLVASLFLVPFGFWLSLAAGNRPKPGVTIPDPSNTAHLASLRAELLPLANLVEPKDPAPLDASAQAEAIAPAREAQEPSTRDGRARSRGLPAASSSSRKLGRDSSLWTLYWLGTVTFAGLVLLFTMTRKPKESRPQERVPSSVEDPQGVKLHPITDTDPFGMRREEAERGDESAQIMQGRTAADGPEAVYWYRKAADQGSTLAQYRLGRLFAGGAKGLTQNDAEAARWFRNAADHGHRQSQYELGRIYEDGTGLPKSCADALSWYRRAAEQGHVLSQENLGRMYASGKGVRPDLVQAYMWLNIAVANTDKEKSDAWFARKDLYLRMTQAQIAEAQRLSSEFAAKVQDPVPDDSSTLRPESAKREESVGTRPPFPDCRTKTPKGQ